MEDSTDNAKKPHRKRQAGAKSDKKKKSKSGPDMSLTAKQRNPKAFAFQSINKVARAVRRTLDVQEKKHHALQVDRSTALPPPVVVAVVGPPKVGKSTVIRCLIKNFTRQKVTTIQGPFTLVSGKKQRLTLIECNNDISSMIDIAKVADLVLLLVDASFGFEMEIFEFLNICQVHGFPRIMGVLTHLDMLPNNKLLRRTKKQLKHRFWTEVYQGAKLFYLSGMVNDEYQRTEIHNLGRFISVMKYRPLQWRATHPYIVADRIEDVTDPEVLRLNAKADRSVCFYGYVRGTHYKPENNIHIPGCGDFAIHEMSLLNDPCPLPDKDKKRSLNDKERVVYAPMSGVGGIVYDKDAIYLELGGSHSLKQESKKPLNELVTTLLATRKTVDEKLADSDFKLFSNSRPVSTATINRSSDDAEVMDVAADDDVTTDDNVTTDDDSDSESMMDEGESDGESKSDDEEEANEELGGRQVKKLKLDESANNDDDEAGDEVDDDDSQNDDDDTVDNDDSNDEEEKGRLKWKSNLSLKASEAYHQRRTNKANIETLIYGNERTELPSVDDPSEHQVGDMFNVILPRVRLETRTGLDGDDVTLTRSVAARLDTLEDILACIKDRFVTGKWKSEEDARTLLDEDDELQGGFVDLETGQTFGKDDDDDDGSSNDGSSDNNSDDDDDDEKATTTEDSRDKVSETASERRQRRAIEKRQEKRRRIKAMFDKEYDAGSDKKTHYEELKAELELQAQINRSEFDSLPDELRTQYEGYRPGVYVRVQVNNAPCELVTNFDPTYPIILGGLLSSEQNFGYVTVRLKKHRWHKRILKTNDPLIISLGWRRFQSTVVFSIQDHNGRHRRLKYTPEHLHCEATFKGPITPKGAGMLAIQSVAGNTPGFRVSATGVVSELDKAFSIMKKIKLIGTPFKIYKKTAFIQGMFTSKLEVTKFEGSQIQTVSGIRGIIKKSVTEGSTKGGSFRATFEDKILLSDIVFVKTWKAIDLPTFYMDVTTLLRPLNDKSEWEGMKSVGQLRREAGIRRQVNQDSLYRPIERKPKVFAPFVVPRELQKQLPFSDKPKVAKPSKDLIQSKRVAIIREPKERKVAELMKRIQVIYDHKRKQDRLEMRQRAQKHEKHQGKIEKNKAVQRKERAKHTFFILGEADKKKKLKQD